MATKKLPPALEKKDAAFDKKAGIKENGKKDKAVDAKVAKSGKLPPFLFGGKK